MNLNTALETLKETIEKIYKDKPTLLEGLNSYLNTLKQSVSKEDSTIEIDILETSRVSELRRVSNYQTSEIIGHTRSPIFVVQDLEFVAVVNEDHYSGESSSDEGEEVFKYEYFAEDRSYSIEEAIKQIEEALQEDPEESLLEAIGDYPDYKINLNDLKEVWEAFSGRNSGLCKYIYKDKIWFLTKKAAEEHIQDKSHRYNRPRIFVKSLIETDFEVLLRDMEFKHYG